MKVLSHLILIATLYGGINMSNATTKPMVPKDITAEIGYDFENDMPEAFTHCSKLTSEGYLEETKEYLINLKGKCTPGIKKLCKDLSKIYSKLQQNYKEKRETFDPKYRLEEYIYECCLKHFWWRYYCPVDQGLVKDYLSLLD